MDSFGYAVEDDRGGMAMGTATIEIDSNDMIVISDGLGLRYVWRADLGGPWMDIGVTGSRGFGWNPDSTELHVVASFGGVFRVPFDPETGAGSPDLFGSIRSGPTDVAVRYLELASDRTLPIHPGGDSEPGTVYVLDQSGNITGDVEVPTDADQIEIPKHGEKGFVSSPDAKRITVLAGDPPMTHQTIALPSGHTAVDMDAAQDGSKVYILSTDGTDAEDGGLIQIYDVESMELLSQTITTSGGASDISVSPDGEELLVTNHEEQAIGIVDTSTDTFDGLVSLGITLDYSSVSLDARAIFIWAENQVFEYDRSSETLSEESSTFEPPLFDHSVGAVLETGSN